MNNERKNTDSFELVYVFLHNVIFFPFSVFVVSINKILPEEIEEIKKYNEMAVCFVNDGKPLNIALRVGIDKIEAYSGVVRLKLEGIHRIKKIRELDKDIVGPEKKLFRAQFCEILNDYGDCDIKVLGPLINGMVNKIGRVNRTNQILELFLVNEIFYSLFGPFAGNFTPLVIHPDFFSWWLDLCLALPGVPYEYKLTAFEELNIVKRFKIFVEDILPRYIDYCKKNNPFSTAFLDKALSKLRSDQKAFPAPRPPQPEEDEEDFKKENIDNDFYERIKNSKMSEEARLEANKELNRLKYINPISAEYAVARTYLDWLMDLPWGIFTEDNFDIRYARQILDEDHAYLDKVKDRIEEYLAVQKLNPDRKGPILCFVGPPGTGKTSIGKSIARALGRKFIKMSLGDINDEAHIRGHRRTYIGALPGRIIQEIKKAGSQNPVFMFDEVDKIGQAYKGDPASALLEVLDSEQNFSFSDHYLDVPFDLSRVMFITTANTLDTVPSALQDRMEIVEFSTYLDFEKLEIAKQQLVPKMIRENGLGAYNIRFKDEALLDIIRFYTKEAGVRDIERKIDALCRKIAKKIGKSEFNLERGDNNIGCQEISGYLGAPKFSDTELLNESELEPGIAVGLVVGEYGSGEILHIEALETHNLTEKFKVTGFTKKVMTQSVEDVVSFLNGHREELDISNECFAKENGIHIRPRYGAVRKEGPSAGLAIGMACYSEYAKKLIRRDAAFTGELTLHGIVDPVGGIREKFLGAKRAGIKRIFLSVKNKSDVEELDHYITEGMEIIYISNIKEIIIGDPYNIFIKDVKNGDS